MQVEVETEKDFEAFWKEYNDLLVFTKKPDKGRKAEDFLYKNIKAEHHDTIAKDLKILRFVKDTDIDKFDSRIRGKFKSLAGRVLKEYNAEIHTVEAFKIPTDYPVVPMIDFHLKKPQAIGFYTCDPQGRNFVIDEVWENLSPEEVADAIIRRKGGKVWNITEAFIDPLSKGDVGYLKNRYGDVEDSFSIIKKKLAMHEIYLDVASKDKDSGLRNVKTWLCGPNKMPVLFFFDTLNEPSAYGHFFEIMRYVYDDEGKPIKENDHFMENLYRYTLTGNKYVPLEDQLSEEELEDRKGERKTASSVTGY